MLLVGQPSQAFLDMYGHTSADAASWQPSQAFRTCCLACLRVHKVVLGSWCSSDLERKHRQSPVRKFVLYPKLAMKGTYCSSACWLVFLNTIRREFPAETLFETMNFGVDFGVDFGVTFPRILREILEVLFGRQASNEIAVKNSHEINTKFTSPFRMSFRVVISDPNFQFGCHFRTPIPEHDLAHSQASQATCPERLGKVANWQLRHLCT